MIGRTWIFVCDDATEADRWMQNIRSGIIVAFSTLRHHLSS